MKKTMKNTASISHSPSRFVALLVALTLGWFLPAWAAPITWGPGVIIAGDTDVATDGTFVYAYYFAASGGPTTVNGVAFTASQSNTSLGGGNVTMNYSAAPFYAYTGTGTPWTGLSAAYRTVLSGGPYGGTPTITLNNLTSGHTYLVQYWVNDSRTGYSPARYETLTSTGGNSVNVSNNVANVASGVGAYAIGVFVASGTTQAFTDTGGGSGTTAQINAILVRDITGLAVNNGVWNTLTPGAKWGTAANWTGSTIANGYGSTADFSQQHITADTSVNLDAPWVIGTLIFGNTSIATPAAWILGTSTNPGSLFMAGSAPTIQVTPLGGTKAATINAALGGTNGLTTTGGGTLTLAANNTFTGGLTISNSTVVAPTWAASTSAQPVGEGNITLAGGTLSYTGAATTAATQSFTNAPGTTSSLLITPTYLQSSGLMTGSGNLNIGGAGTTGTLIFQTASGVNSFSGTITIGNGGLQLNQCDPGANAAFVLNSGGALNILSTAAAATRTLGSLSGNGTLSGGYGYTTTIQIGSLNTSTVFSGIIQNNNGKLCALTKIGTGSLALAGANTYGGGTTLSNGTLCVNSATALGTNTLTIAGGALDNTSTGPNTLANNNAQIWNTNFAFIGTQNLNLGSGAVAMTNGSLQVTASGGNLTVGGVISDSGLGYGLTKLGAGTLTLTNANTYSGATTISAGSLVGVAGGSCASSAISVAATSGNTATLGVSVPNTANQWTCSSLTVNNAGTSSGLGFNFGLLPPGTSVAPLNVAGAITLTTAPTIAIAGASLPISGVPGYPLVTWGSGSPTTNGMVLTLPTRIAGNLAIVGNTLYLQITGSTEPLTWQPGNGSWNTTQNLWEDNTAATTAYIDGTPGDSVLFNDTPGAGSFLVTLNNTYQPASVTLNNTNANYTISGTGAIGGSGTTLTKNGNGTLTLTTTNTFGGGAMLNGGMLVLAAPNTFSGGVTVNGGTLDLTVSNAYSGGTTVNGGSVVVTAPNNYSGGTTINSGSVQLGDGVANNGSVTGLITDNASLVIANPAAQTNNNVISGTGSVTKSGAGTLTVSAANTFAGGMNINNGMVVLGSGTPLGSTATNTVIASSATLDLAGNATALNNPVVVSGGGVGGTNAITSSAQIASPYIGLRYVTLAGDVVLNAATRWDIGNNNSSGGTITGAGHKLTVCGTNDVSWNYLGETDLGDVVVSNRTLYLQGNTTLGRTANTVYIYPGSSLNLYGSGLNITKPLALNGGSLANGSGSPTYSGSVTVNANSTISAAGTFNISGVISGTNALTFTGGTTELTATNPFSGPVTNSSGTLQFGDGVANLGSVVTTNIVDNGGTVTFANYTNQSFTGTISGSGSANLGKSGPGALTLNLAGTNVLSSVIIGNGSATINNATLKLSGNLGAYGSATPVLNLNNVTNSSSGVYVGYTGNTTGILNVNSGSISASSYLFIGYGSGANPSTLNINGGVLSGNPCYLTQHGNGYLWLNAGVLQVPFIESLSTTSVENYAHLYFNGGTLRATTSTANFIYANLNDCNVSTNASTIDNNGYAITIPMAIQEDANLAAIPATDGGLIFTGTNTTTLTGANTYTGPTVVENGNLVTSATYLTGGGSLVVSNSILNLNSTPSSLNAANVGITNSTLVFNLGNLGISGLPGYPLINASGNYASAGTIHMTIQGGGLTAGNLVLVHYAGTEQNAAAYAIPHLPTGFSATVLDDTANQNITLVVSAVPAALTWTGSSSTWDTNDTGNLTWELTSDLATPEYYAQNSLGGPSITFDDNVGSGMTAISLSEAVSPLTVTINNNSYNYSLTGAGKISGAASLTMTGIGTFVLGTANDYTNGTTQTAGALVLTNGSNRLPASGALTLAGNTVLDLGLNSQAIGALTATNTVSSTSIVTNGNNLTINGSVNVGAYGPAAFVTLDTSSLGSLTMNEPAGAISVGGSYLATADSYGATWLLPANSALTVNSISIGQGGTANAGGITNLGTMEMGQLNAIYASQISLGAIRSAGTLEFEPGLINPSVTLRNTNGGNSRVSLITVGQNTAGGTGQCFGLMDFSAGSVDLMATNMVLGYMPLNNAPVSPGTVIMSNGVMDILNLTLSRNAVAGGTGGQNGTFEQDAGTNKVQTLVLGDNQGITGTPTLTAVYNLNGGLLEASNISAGIGTFNNASTRIINWNGGTIQNYDNATPLSLNGVAGGSIGLVLGTNSPTIFSPTSGQTITVGPNAVLSDSSNGPATLVVAGAGTLQINCTDNSLGGIVVSNGVFGGTGTLAGTLAVNPGATLAPGTAAIGTLTVNNNLNLSGNLLFKLNKALTQSNDLVVVTGGLTNLGMGTLTLTNIGVPTLANGDTFQLFSQPVFGGGSFVINPPTPGAGLAWTNQLALNDTVGVVSLVTIAANPTNLSYSVSSGVLTMTWPQDHLGWLLQSNSVNLAAPADWYDLSNTATGTSYSISINPAQANVFYRLRHP